MGYLITSITVLGCPRLEEWKREIEVSDKEIVLLELNVDRSVGGCREVRNT